MSNAKHTPGPWRVAFDMTVTASAAGVVEGSKHIADCGNTLRKDSENIANARLIAAAPEMADLIEELVSCFLSRDESGAFQSFNLDAEFCSKAFSVIAKARGE